MGSTRAPPYRRDGSRRPYRTVSAPIYRHPLRDVDSHVVELRRRTKVIGRCRERPARSAGAPQWSRLRGGPADGVVMTPDKAWTALGVDAARVTVPSVAEIERLRRQHGALA